MDGIELARIGLYLAPNDRFAPWYREVLEHCGLQYEIIDASGIGQIGGVDVLVLAGSGTLDQAQIDSLNRWVRQGGSIVAGPTTWGLDVLLGVTPKAGPEIPARDVISPTEQGSDFWPTGAGHCLFFGGTYVDRTDSTVLGTTENNSPAITERTWQNGGGYFLCAHLGETMSLMQGGRSVDSGTIGPSDGSCRMNESVLHAEGGTNLDFWRDRSQPEGCPNAFFTEPHADVLKELWIGLILKAVHRTGKNALMFWPWPTNATGAACVSIDCEEFDPSHVGSIYKMLVMMGAPASWLVGLPGYPQDVYRQLLKWGHDVGLLFITDDHNGWSEEKMKIQHLALARSATMPHMVTARPVHGRWKSHQLFYELSEIAGARVSVGKGGRQPGTSGFLFGTSHPFFPHRRDGHAFKVMELPYVAYLPGVQTPDSVVEAMLPTIAARHGCFHFGFKSDAMSDPASANGLRRAVSLAKQSGLTFMTASEIYNFERTRRALRRKFTMVPAGYHVHLVAEQAMDGLTLMISEPGLEFHFNGRHRSAELVKRFGVMWSAHSFDLEAKTSLELSISPGEQNQLAA